MSFNVLAGMVFVSVGILLLICARPLAALMVRMAQWQLDIMRRSSFAWYYRCIGLVFVASGIALALQSSFSE